ncbi:hypothetical protein RQP46_002166 [Phenoliferia psychrophenolica]
MLLRRAVLIPLRPSTRPFFSFPFSGTPPSQTPSPPSKGSLTHRGSISIYTESRILPYSPQELYAIIADVDSYHDFLPFATASRVLSAVRHVEGTPGEIRDLRRKEWLVGDREVGEGERWEMEAELKAGAMGFVEGYVSRVEAIKYRSVSAKARDSTLFKHLETSWTLSPSSTSPSPSASPSSTANDRTKVDLYLAYAFASPLHAAVVSGAWEKVSGMMIDGFEKRLRSIYGER